MTNNSQVAPTAWDNISETEKIAGGETGGEYPAKVLTPNILIILQGK